MSYLQCIVTVKYKVLISGPAILIVLSRDNLVRRFSGACWIQAISGDQLFFILPSPIKCVYKGGEAKVGITRKRDNEIFLEYRRLPLKKGWKKVLNITHIISITKVQ